MMLRSWWQDTICAFCMHLSAPTEFCGGNVCVAFG